MSRVSTYLDFSNPVYLRALGSGKDISPDENFIVFAGRSNTGKSSVINALCNGRFARVSRTPGRTRAIQLFNLGHVILADFPGYGYAAVSKQEKRLWEIQITQFLATANIICVVAIVDCRRGIAESDTLLLHWFEKRQTPVIVLLNKADKLNQQQRHAAITLANKENATTNILFSARRKTGVIETRQTIAHQCGGQLMNQGKKH